MTPHPAKPNLLIQILASVASVLVLIAPSAPALAAAPDPNPCAAQLAAVQSVGARIAAHNAKPHVFQLPRQAAQLAAYNAEAAKLNADKTAVTGRLQACIQAMTALEDNQPGSPAFKPGAPDELRTALDDAKKKIPPGWQPRTSPVSPAKGWQVPRTAPERPIYDLLRKNNPGEFGNVSLQGSPRPAVGAADPAYPGRVIGLRADNTSPAVTPDHVVPLAEVIYMPGFMRLNADNMYRVANAPVNLQWLSYSSNLSKSSRSAAAMAGVDPAWQASQVALENSIRTKLLDTIQKLLESQG